MKILRSFQIILLLVSVGLHSVASAAVSDSEYDAVLTDRERKIDAIRREEIQTVSSALRLRSPENRQAELYLRLAELYLEAYQADFLLEGRIHEARLKRQPQAKLERRRSSEDLKNGVRAAEQILKMKVDGSKLDRVHYFLAYNYGELGNKDESIKHYSILMKDYPQSPFSNEGQRAVADALFQKGQFQDAEEAYLKALKRAKDPGQQARIYHRLAWCAYRNRKPAEAIDSMKRAIQIAEDHSEKSLSVREEGLRDLAIFYAETPRVEEAIQYYRDHSGDDDQLSKTLERLGREYERGGQTDKSRVVYEALLRINVKDESSFRATVKIFDLMLLRQQFEEAARLLDPIQIPKNPDPDTNIVIQNLRTTVRKTAVDYHDRFRKDTDVERGRLHLKVSDRFYGLFLKLFLSNPSTAASDKNEIRMYWAEVKRETDQPGAAASLYKQVVIERDSKYGAEAARWWVSSLINELKKMSQERERSGQKLGSKPSDIEYDFVEASDILEKSIPNTIESRESRLRAAQILAAYPDDKRQAIDRAKSLALFAPTTPQGVLAARLWLQLDTTRDTVLEIRNHPELMTADAQGAAIKNKKELAQDLESAEKRLNVGEIASLERNKDYLEAAKRYEQYAGQAKTEAEAEKAYMGAINAYAQNGNSDEVARTMSNWIQRFPKSKLCQKTVKEQATNFFIRGWYSDSAELFLGIGRQFKDVSSYLTAAALFDGAQLRQKARDAFRAALPLVPDEEERARIYKSNAEVSGDMKDELGTFNSWRSCFILNSSLKAECGSQVGNYYLKLNDVRAGRDAFTQVVNLKKGPSSKSPYIAYAQFRLAQILEREMKRTALEFPQDRLLKAFTTRVEELKPVSDAYQKAIGMGGPWGIAATERLGDLALGLSSEVEQALSSSQASPDLKQALIPVANALKTKAIDNSKTAYSQALKQQILSPALPVVHDRLVDVGTKNMARAQGARSGIRLIGIAADGGSVGADSAFNTVREGLLKNTADALLWIDYGNLLWGTGKPGLSKVAYQRSLALKTRMADALNNTAVVMVSDQGYENWFSANEAVATWKRALSYEPMNSAALFNLGHYFNYFRLFPLAIPYLEKVSRKVSIGEVNDGLGVAHFATKRTAEANLQFQRADELGQKSNRFVRKYIEAVTASSSKDCKDALSDIDGELKGFEKVSVERLQMRCGP